MSKIKSVEASEILDSREMPTIKVVCLLDGGFAGEASVPSGKSTGSHESLELRDGDKDRYAGLGVEKAIRNVNEEINSFLKNKNFNQSSLDALLVDLDGTKNKSRLGANAILGVSLAFARAQASEKKMELYEHLSELAENKIFKIPQPMLNIINGGEHSGSGLDVQEFLIVPVGLDSFHDKIEASSKVIATLKKILEDSGHTEGMGDEGGFAPKLASNEEALEILTKAILESGYTLNQIKISMDVAASTFYKDGIYTLKIAGKKENINTEQILAWYEKLVDEYPIFSIEDGFAEDDWMGFEKMNENLGKKIMIVGDDLTVTNPKRIEMAIEKKAINCVLIKPNQIGTLSETIQAILLTKKQGWACFVSHRSGETMDTFIADLAVGLGCEYIKAGSLTKKERIVKYDRLLQIENILNKKE